MPTTSNFGWTTPADTDLVKDGAAAIRTLGNGIDTSLVDLKGGTTGQILSKNSNTDLDYTWINNDQGDITEVQAGTGISVASGTGPVPVVTNTVATTFDAKGDLVVGTGADTFAKLTVGANGSTLVADSAQTTGLKWAAPAGGGLVFISSTDISGTSTSVNNCFTSSYANYVIQLWIDSASTTAEINMRMRLSGSDYTVSTDYVQRQIKSTPADSLRSSWFIMDNANSYGFATIQLGGPQLATRTLCNILASALDEGTSGNSFASANILQGTSNQFDGFTIFSTATITGKVRVYGYANS